MSSYFEAKKQVFHKSRHFLFLFFVYHLCWPDDDVRGGNMSPY